jgi:methionine-R-sulfoxide reductase
LREKERSVHRTLIYYEEGTYCCGACSEPLFESNSKFDAHCGWPSFDDSIPGKVKYVLDKTHGMTRTEIVCANCGSHLGHLFNDGPTATGQRYCVNSYQSISNNKWIYWETQITRRKIRTNSKRYKGRKHKYK